MRGKRNESPERKLGWVAAVDGRSPMWSGHNEQHVYSVISYYLRHRSEVEAYMATREKEGDEIQQGIEAQQGDLTEIRERLDARRMQQG